MAHSFPSTGLGSTPLPAPVAACHGLHSHRAACHKPVPLCAGCCRCSCLVSSLVYSNCAYFRQQDVNIFAQVALNSTRHAPNTHTQRQAPSSSSHTHTHTHTIARLIRRVLLQLGRLIVLLLFNAILLVLANFELSPSVFVLKPSSQGNSPGKTFKCAYALQYSPKSWTELWLPSKRWPNWFPASTILNSTSAIAIYTHICRSISKLLTK